MFLLTPLVRDFSTRTIAPIVARRTFFADICCRLFGERPSTSPMAPKVRSSASKNSSRGTFHRATASAGVRSPFLTIERKLNVRSFSQHHGAARSLGPEPSAVGCDDYDAERARPALTAPEYFNFASDVIDGWAEIERVYFITAINFSNRTYCWNECVLFATVTARANTSSSKTSAEQNRSFNHPTRRRQSNRVIEHI